MFGFAPVATLPFSTLVSANLIIGTISIPVEIGDDVIIASRSMAVEIIQSQSTAVPLTWVLSSRDADWTINPCALNWTFDPRENQWLIK